jgi:hypothetical protein
LYIIFKDLFFSHKLPFHFSENMTIFLRTVKATLKGCNRCGYGAVGISATKKPLDLA